MRGRESGRHWPPPASRAGRGTAPSPPPRGPFVPVCGQQRCPVGPQQEGAVLAGNAAGRHGPREAGLLKAGSLQAIESSPPKWVSPPSLGRSSSCWPRCRQRGDLGIPETALVSPRPRPAASRSAPGCSPLQPGVSAGTRDTRHGVHHTWLAGATRGVVGVPVPSREGWCGAEPPWRERADSGGVPRWPVSWLRICSRHVTTSRLSPSYCGPADRPPDKQHRGRSASELTLEPCTEMHK